MTTGRGWYVKAFRLDQAWRLVSGPFDDHDPVFEEARRIRPLYPDACALDVILHTGKSLPERKPRIRPPGDQEEPTVPEFDLRNVAGRRAAARALVDHIEALGCRATLEDWDGEPDVTGSAPSLHAQIWLAWTPQAPMPIISWYGSAYSLRDVVPGAWGRGDVNPYHRAKTTSLPATWPELFDALEIGLLAAIDGSAFDL